MTNSEMTMKKLRLMWMIGLLAGVALGAGCGDATDSDVEPASAAAQQSLESLEPAESVDSQPLDDKDSTQTKGIFFDWDMVAEPPLVSDGTTIVVSWRAGYGEVFDFCWEKKGDPALICSGDHQTTVTASGYNYSNGRVYAEVGGLECDGETYRFRAKRSLVSMETEEGTTAACSCSDPCPEGGWYDGANCYLGTPPDGTDAFIWNGNYYYTPKSSAPICPMNGSWDDGANCHVGSYPTNVEPFIWDNHFYYEACPGM